jgi:hypothetical protein
MTFLNLVLLGGTLAGGIPIAIHLLHRRRLNTVRWGAMAFLRAHPVQNQRRPKLEHLLLLFIRISLPVLLALCMARPVLTGIHALSGTAPASTVILLDNSASMAASTAGRSGFERAREEAARIIRALPRGSEVAVLPLDDPDKPLLPPTVNLKTAAEFVEGLAPRNGWTATTEGFEAATRALSQMHHAQRQVILLTDFQKVNWHPNDATARQRGMERLLGLPLPPRVILFNVGAGAALNVSVESLEFSKSPLGAGQKTSFRATLRNFSSQPIPDLRVVWKVDGAIRNEVRVTLESRSSTQSVFAHTFAETGSHFVEVGTDADSLTADNLMLASLPVRERIRVLLVDGHPSSEPLQGETDFLSIALQPRPETPSLLAPTTIEPSALTAKALAKTAVLVLANVRSLGPQQVREVEEFVRQGGGLLVFPGNRVDALWYNQTLFKQGGGLLPASLESLHDTSLQGRPAGIQTTRLEHPALESFNTGGLSLHDSAIRSWYSLNPAPQTATDDSPGSTMISLDNGDPLFVERRFGAGSVILAAIPCNAEWSNLPARPGFVPLMQRLVVALSAATLPARNLAPGDPILGVFQNPPGNKDPQACLTRPDGTSLWFPLQKKGDRWLLENTDTRDPGLYSLTGPDGETQHFAVNAGRRESDPELLGLKEITETATALNATLVQSGEELRALERESRYGQELWRMLLFVVLIFAFAEIYLQQRFRTRKGAQI